MPAGTMSGEVNLAESTGIDQDFSCPSVEIAASSCRWGDYAGASPDPASPYVVWGTGEVNGPVAFENEAQWQTENFALALHASPTAEFSIVSASPTAGTPVSFDASASSDSAEALTRYDWSFGDGTGGSGEKPSHTYGGPGKYTVTLTVADATGTQSSVEHEVTVADAPPVAVFTVSTPTPTVGSPVGFDGSGSHDPDGSLISYSWTFGDGSPPQEGVAPTHTYAVEGKYTVTLTVMDEGLLTNKVTHEVAVTVAPPSSAKTSNTTGGETGKEGTPPGGSSSATPSNLVHVTGVKQNKKKGTVALGVSVPGAGVLSAREASAAHGSLVSPLAGALVAPAAYPVALVAAKKGKAKAKGPFVKPVTVSVSAAGKVTIQIVPNAAGSALLKSKHKLALKILIAFTPTGGTQGMLVQPVTLVLSVAKRHK
jgi:PKD repeat protein